MTRAEDVDAEDFRARLPRFTGAALAANAAILDGVRAVAARHEGATPGQVALAWVLAQGPHVHAIPGTTRRAHLRSNIEAARITLDEEDPQILDRLPDAVGSRY